MGSDAKIPFLFVLLCCWDGMFPGDILACATVLGALNSALYLAADCLAMNVSYATGPVPISRVYRVIPCGYLTPI